MLWLENCRIDEAEHECEQSSERCQGEFPLGWEKQMPLLVNFYFGRVVGWIYQTYSIYYGRLDILN